MKAFVLAIALLSFSASVAQVQDPVKVLKTKNTEAFVFRVDPKFIGGEVEVISATGDSVVKEMLHKRKMKIDFRNVKSGTYTVKVKKGMLVEQFQYQKR